MTAGAMAMPYSGWRFSCDRATMERCAGALEIKANECMAQAASPDATVCVPKTHEAIFAMGAAAALRCILADGDGIEPTEFAGQVMARAGVE